ncbi:MAG: hypothetical protein Tsb005_04880 [Gammaproteobacteria bacterium]
MLYNDMQNLIKQLKDFLGARVLWLGFNSIALGLLQFIVDLSLAFSINALFFILGLVTSIPTILGITLNHHHAAWIFVLFLVTGSLRGFITCYQAYATGVVLLEFESLNRARLIRWAFANRSTKLSDVSNLFNNCTVAAANFISSLMGSSTRIVVSFLLFISLCNLSWITTISVMSAFLLILVPSKLVSKHIHAISHQVHHYLDYSVERLLTGVKNNLLLHIYGSQVSEASCTLNSLENYRQKYRRYYFFAGVKGMLAPVFGIWIICLISVIVVKTNAMQGGILISYFYLFLRFTQSLGELANLFSYVSLTKPRFLELYRWWLTSRDLIDDLQLNHVSIDNGNKPKLREIGWEANQLSFSYADDGKPIFDNLQFKINPGEMFVITGKSGVGKSTLLSLLLGLEKPGAGQLTLICDGESRTATNIHKLIMSNVGYVGPESFMIPGTIFENLCYGSNLNYSEEEVKKALKIAECQFVFDLPDGLKHQLTEQGEGLSAGQKQRLSLARALLRNPSLLILDEATANLDKKTELSLVSTLAKLKKSMTIVAVTHREALITIGDQVLAL